MKKCIKNLTALFFISALLVSCSKDNDPSDDNLFVGTYNGSVSYSETSGNTSISTDDGRVTLVKVGDSYNFDFSDGIPSLKGIKIDKNENILISSDGGIKIDEGNLTIAYSKDGEVWGADCTR
ncbi:hypothetical protein D9O36_17965 [Zobellia amurskyensis]|uniref:Lipoprotein n=1 Tax=Zobellia amurskyensis TaxID=248905 RepID=A0A7X3D334_9FLAO|nr:hypothetical protein [Zobellia amurskyensis]MUH37741.1 hypothetical protein [Zobellia amurskyensis]